MNDCHKVKNILLTFKQFKKTFIFTFIYVSRLKLSLPLSQQLMKCNFKKTVGKLKATENFGM